MSLIKVDSLADVESLVKSNYPVVLLFWAEWQDLSKPGGAYYEIVETLAASNSTISVRSVEAEKCVEICESFGISVVPSVIAILGDVIVAKIEGANPPELKKAFTKLDSVASLKKASTESIIPQSVFQISLEQRLKTLIESAEVMLFMKGDPEKARCGFSRQMVEILRDQGIEFSSFDILGDEEVRQGLKTYSNWPTYPQLYVRGVLIGGLDIVKEMLAMGDLSSQLEVKPTSKRNLNEYLHQLINQEPVMLFMKGSPATPRCGFSRQMVNLLQEQGIVFGSFDILTDEDVRQGLKTYSDWPTYPQLYVKGQLIGGLDIVKEMINSSSTPLKTQLAIE